MIHPSRQAYVEDAEAENIPTELNLSNVPLDQDYNITTESGLPAQTASSILAQFDRRRFAATIAVPTDDGRVRTRLRELGEPITLFGEGPAERRDRLRDLLTTQAEAKKGDTQMEDVEIDEVEEQDEELQNEEYSTIGSDELLKARQALARISLPRAQRRIATQRLEASIPLRTHVRYRRRIKEHLGGFELFGSQVASDRPLASVSFSPDNELVATGSWSGSIKVLSMPNLEEKVLLRGHNEIVSGIAWYSPQASDAMAEREGPIDVASGGGEGNINLWKLSQDTPVSTLSGHEGRVSKVNFHPSGKHLMSASYDTTWRLWDIETTQELLCQDGHSREVHALACNTDGSLLVTGGLDSVGRVWDLRTGKSVMFLDSHIAPIYALDWGTDGYRVLSGSADGFIKCWDVRAVRETTSIGGHTGGITDLKWFQGATRYGHNEELEKDEKGDWIPRKGATFFVSAGFDKSVKIFSADDWALCKTMEGHSGNVTGIDVSSDAQWIVSSGRDRTVKLWARDDMSKLQLPHEM